MQKTYPIICSVCRCEAEVPFQPKDGQKLTCKACYKEKLNPKKEDPKLKIKDEGKARIVNHSLEQLSQSFNLRKNK